MRSAAVLLAVTLLCFGVVSVVAEDLRCASVPQVAMRKARPAGNYHICVIEGSGVHTVKLCTRETFAFPAENDKMKFRHCSRGNQYNKKAWFASYQNAAVIISNEIQDLVDTWPAAEVYTRIGCTGFFTSLVLKPDLAPTTIEAMFSKLTNCHISDYIQSQAQARVTSALGLLADAIGAIPNPATIITGLVIKTVVVAVNSQVDAKEDDWMKFLQVHLTIASIRVRCGAVEGPRVKQCLKPRSLSASSSGKYKLTFTGCQGGSASSDYIQVWNGNSKRLTTDGGGVFSDGVLHKLCSSGTSFLYTQIILNPAIQTCFKIYERNTLRDDTYRGEGCIPRLNDQNTIRVPATKGTVTISFQAQSV